MKKKIDKIIQICVAPATNEVLALTKNGKIFGKKPPFNNGMAWIEVGLPASCRLDE